MAEANTAQHTPGPWAVHCSHIYAPDGAIIAQVHNPGGKESDYPLVGNRNLMAAAPELLEAIQETFVLEDRILDDIFGYEWLEKARDAIARATGAA